MINVIKPSVKTNGKAEIFTFCTYKITSNRKKIEDTNIVRHIVQNFKCSFFIKNNILIDRLLMQEILKY